MNKLAIVMPVHNEEKNIPIIIERIEKEVKYPHIINIIYDSDDDVTIPVILTEKQKYKTSINLIKNTYGEGVLNALKTGFETSQSEFIVIIMADLSDPPNVINNMLKKAEAENADIVCGSRYMKGGKQVGGEIIKSLLSQFACLSLYFLAKVPTHDATNNFKLYRKSFLQKILIESTGGFEVGLELVVKGFLGGYKICEVPTTWQNRISGKSNFKIIEWFPSYLKWFFKVFIHKENRNL